MSKACCTSGINICLVWTDRNWTAETRRIMNPLWSDFIHSLCRRKGAVHICYTRRLLHLFSGKHFLWILSHLPVQAVSNSSVMWSASETSKWKKTWKPAFIFAVITLLSISLVLESANFQHNSTQSQKWLHTLQLGQWRRRLGGSSLLPGMLQRAFALQTLCYIPKWYPLYFSPPNHTGSRGL